ncbi:MAG: glycoside hydrolase family 88 protein [Opitutaceae bacterium]
MHPVHPRRQFLRAAAFAGGALGLSTLVAGATALAAPDPESPAAADAGELRVRRVRAAMLAMQRRAWEQGTAAQALLELGDTETVVLLAKDAVVNQLKDGRLVLNEGNAPVCDPCVNGEPVLFAARATGDAALQHAADRMLEFALHKAPRTRDGIVFHNQIENRIWVDAFYMLPPFLAVAGHPHEALRQCAGFRRILRDPQTKLYSHMWDADRQDFERKAFWASGNGWALAGMARVLRALPATMAAERAQLAEWIRELVEAVLPWRRADDGLFHDVFDDPGTFVETNFAQMLAYTLYRGVAEDWIPLTFLATAESLRAAAIAKVDAFGLVQGVCGAPHFNRPGTSTEGQAFHLLMEAARRDCLQDHAARGD